MTGTVKLQPSGHQFIVHPDESILEAGLRAGLALDYRCSNGNCGECKGRVVSGEIAALHAHDYRLTEAEKAQRYVLLCSVTAQGDCVVEAHEAASHEDIPVQKIQAKVSRLEKLSPEVMLLGLRTPRTQHLRFLAGQHVSLVAHGLKPRNKSVASCPCNGLNLEFHVRRVADDPFSDYVWNGMHTSEEIRIDGPWGAFHLDEDTRGPILFIAWDTGFAPIKSLIEHAIALELHNPVRLVWIVPPGNGPYLDNLCRSWEDAFDHFRYDALTLDTDSVSMVARILADEPDLSEHHVYLVGPGLVTAGMIPALLARGLSEDRLHMDYFSRY